MPCWRTPSTSSKPNALEPTNESSLKYSGVSSQNVGPCTPAFTSVPRAARTRAATSNVSCLPTVSYTTSMPPGYAIGSPSLGLQHAARPGGGLLDDLHVPARGRYRCAELAGRSACASKRATTSTSTSGYSARRIAVAQVPSAPAPYTITLPPGGGGWRVIACNDHRERVGKHGDARRDRRRAP